MKVLGIEIPPADELMPGPIAEPGAGNGAAQTVEARSGGRANGASSNGAGEPAPAEASS
jgi:hypothetical protein